MSIIQLAAFAFSHCSHGSHPYWFPPCNWVLFSSLWAAFSFLFFLHVKWTRLQSYPCLNWENTTCPYLMIGFQCLSREISYLLIPWANSFFSHGCAIMLHVAFTTHYMWKQDLSHCCTSDCVYGKFTWMYLRLQYRHDRQQYSWYLYSSHSILIATPRPLTICILRWREFPVAKLFSRDHVSYLDVMPMTCNL